MRAHQHAAGARKAPPAPVAQRGRPRGRTRSIRCCGNWPSGWRRWSDRRMPGTLPWRIHHFVADGRCRPLAFVLTPGHYGDGPQLEHVLEQISVPRPGAGRPRTRPDRVLADKACTSRSNRRCLRRRGIRHTIPERLDQRRPTGFDREHYRKPNTVARAVNRLNGFRAVAHATRNAPASTSEPSPSQAS
ncbi:transposase [Streptomyces flaveolus]|uniref:transposase n=1 Tax=Streptomyces flaveolus TaxID=67297 RepID=UPI00382318FB